MSFNTSICYFLRVCCLKQGGKLSFGILDKRQTEYTESLGRDSVSFFNLT